MQLATFAGGCFWAIEAGFRKIEGVTKTTAGYTGGGLANPSYEQVSRGNTGHAEAVEVEFDPKVVSYNQLLDQFWLMHDPTQMNRQGPDVGRQYRSAIFYHSDEQQEQAKKSMQELDASGHFDKPVVTEVVAAGVFYPAEEYHQRFLEKRGEATSTEALKRA